MISSLRRTQGRACDDQGRRLEEPKMDAVIGLHLGCCGRALNSGAVGYRYGALMARQTGSSFTLEGGRSWRHAASHTVDPLAWVPVRRAAPADVSREVQPADSAVVTVADLQGGTLPEHHRPSCTIAGTVSLTLGGGPEAPRNRIS
jgi:amidohydrolase